MAAPDSQTFPATSGTVMGWVGIAVCAGLAVLAVVEDRSAATVRWVLVMVLIGVLVYAFLLRPRIRVEGASLVLVNPLETTVVPFGAITGFVVRQATVVDVGERRYVGVAIGRPLRQVVRGQDRAPGAPPGLGKLASAGSADSEPRGRDLTIDLLEDRVRSGRRDASGSGGAVEKTWAWPLVGLIAVLAVAVVVAFVV